jgi:hypothetical protein
VFAQIEAMFWHVLLPSVAACSPHHPMHTLAIYQPSTPVGLASLATRQYAQS